MIVAEVIRAVGTSASDPMSMPHEEDNDRHRGRDADREAGL
jgi:hypothetical protein